MSRVINIVEHWRDATGASLIVYHGPRSGYGDIASVATMAADICEMSLRFPADCHVNVNELPRNSDTKMHVYSIGVDKKIERRRNEGE